MSYHADSAFRIGKSSNKTREYGCHDNVGTPKFMEYIVAAYVDCSMFDNLCLHSVMQTTTIYILAVSDLCFILMTIWFLSTFLSIQQEIH